MGTDCEKQAVLIPANRETARGQTELERKPGRQRDTQLPIIRFAGNLAVRLQGPVNYPYLLAAFGVSLMESLAPEMDETRLLLSVNYADTDNMVSILKRIWDRPGRVAAGLNIAYQTRLGLWDYNHAGEGIFERDWDNLIILDACRYGKFETCSTLDGELSKMVSRASATEEFITANFTGKQLHDTVYVSANGWYGKLRDSISAELHDYQFVERDWLDGFSTYPSTVTEHGRTLAEEYPRKRLIVHYMQPHKPYLGDVGSEFTYVGDLYDTVKASDASRREVNAAYDETLRCVLDEVEKLSDDLEGKTVVTGDHGELLGERQSPIPIHWYGHLKSLYVPELVEVPWHVCPYETRKEIVADPPAETDSEYTIEEVEEQLVGLGYLEG